MTEDNFIHLDFSSENVLGDRLFDEVEKYRIEHGFEMDRKEYLCTRAFEVSMQNLFNNESRDGRTVCTTEADEEKIAILKNIIESQSDNITTRFAAFVFLFTAYRREDHPDQVRDLVDESRPYFRNLKIYPEYDLLSIRNKGIYRKEDVPRYLSMCRSVCEENPTNVGATNAACEIVASLAERYLLDEDERPELLEEYIQRMKDSIESDPEYGVYSSFYATLGHLYSLADQYDESILYLQKAIDMDTLSQRTSRIAKWYGYIDSVKLRQSINSRINNIFSQVMTNHLNFQNEDKLVGSFRTAILSRYNSDGAGMRMDEYLQTRSFEISILEMYDREIKGLGSQTICSKLEDAYKIQALNRIIENGNYELGVRFAAFIFLFTAFRREAHPIQLREMVVRYRPTFDDLDIYVQYDLLSYAYAGSFDAVSVKAYLEKCKKLVEALPKNSGAINSASEVVLSFAEQGLLDDREDKQFILMEYQKLMLDVVTSHQDANSSSFNATLGRLYAQTGDYARAKQHISTAIDVDHTNQRQSRVITWNSIIDSINANQSLQNKQKELEEKIAKLNDEYDEKLESMQKKHTYQLTSIYRGNMEKSTVILVVFAGLVALILGAIHLAAEIQPSDAVAYILGFTGALLVMVAALVSVIRIDFEKERGKSDLISIAILLIMGLIVLSVALFLMI